MAQENSQVYVCCPGHEIPNWFNYKSKWLSININLPPNWFSNNFLGFALCAVVTFKDYYRSSSLYFQTGTKFETNSGKSYKFWTWSWGWLGDEIPCVLPVKGYVTRDHEFLWYDYRLNLEFVEEKDRVKWSAKLHDATKVSFEFHPMELFDVPVDDAYVRRCGVRLLYAQDFPWIKK